eukprot:2470718-Prymnesium_polylepis.1
MEEESQHTEPSGGRNELSMGTGRGSASRWCLQSRNDRKIAVERLLLVEEKKGSVRDVPIHKFVLTDVFSNLLATHPVKRLDAVSWRIATGFTRVHEHAQ